MFSYLRKMFLYLLYPSFRRGNKFIIHKQNGKTIETTRYKGLTIRFKGKNNTIEIYEPINFKKRLLSNRSKIKICGNDNYILFRESNHYIANFKVLEMGNNNKILIDKNFYQSGEFIADFCNLDNKILKIGSNCMFGQQVEFMLGDWHTIYNNESNECINKSSHGITIGNHVWLARSVKILKDVTIQDNSIVGIGSLVTKNFDEENCILAGVPAKIVKRNINWNYKNPK